MYKSMEIKSYSEQNSKPKMRKGQINDKEAETSQKGNGLVFPVCIALTPHYTRLINKLIDKLNT